ncbi:MAG: TldD/PmbA family protein [Piscinibacter sp.]|uniref:metallopeptidase TldD-related protein n=1 Tax=Piscinibacter sp. TaxID=1903157 RepID=UPI00258F785E|nr:metallopeptidase TldD-related protein [Piscinibacter sp.]MCW5663543.1 TldD/PmbA family protein [Piscinibacter sp.]
MIGRAEFEALADAVCHTTDSLDRCLLLLHAEASSFIRFNGAQVRQATGVEQAHATVTVVRGRRRVEARVTLSGRPAHDLALLQRERALAVAALDDVADDPHLLLPDAPARSERIDPGRLPEAGEVVRRVAEAAAGLDFVGFYAGGPMLRAFADSLGSRHWHQVESFHFDWCLVQSADKAVKSFYAGTRWDGDEFARRVAAGAAQLPLLALPPRRLVPGAYRSWFAPAAMAELLGTVAWAGLGARGRRTGTSSLMRLAHRDAVLSPEFSLDENLAEGLAPAFTAEGFVRPPRVSLVERGLATDTLNSARSAQEYGLPANGANANETPEALALAPGRLNVADPLATLGTGLYVSNLWYLNYSDRLACRMTGLTRFACLWVEDGRPVAPVTVMRFDDSFLRMFGEGLLGLGDQAELIPESGTYNERQLMSISTPGALVEGWRLTL